MNISLEKVLAEPFTENEINFMKKKAKNRIFIMVSLLFVSFFIGVSPLFYKIATVTKTTMPEEIALFAVIGIVFMMVLFFMSYFFTKYFLIPDTIDKLALDLDDFRLAEKMNMSVIEQSKDAYDFYKKIKSFRDVYVFEYEIMKDLCGYTEPFENTV